MDDKDVEAYNDEYGKAARIDEKTEEKAKLKANEALMNSKSFILGVQEENGNMVYIYLFNGDVNVAERLGLMRYLQDKLQSHGYAYSIPEQFKREGDGGNR